MKYFFLLFFLIFSFSKNAFALEKNETVIVLHGLFRSSDNMQSLADFIKENGYHVINVDYPTIKIPIEEIRDNIYQEIKDPIKESLNMHFVCYSLGCLITRAILEKYRFDNLGRVVMLSPPNKGSQVADFLKDFWIYKKYAGPAGQQLTTNQTQIINTLGDIYYPVGIIAGNKTIDPISSFIIPGDDDGKVSIENTKIENMTDHIVIPASHFFLPQNKTAWKQTIFFLKNGRFSK